MTLRTVTSALDPLTLTEWRNTIAAWCGVAYASLDSTAQTELNRYIDEAHEFISERYGHEPWTMREQSLSIAANSNTFTLDADLRDITVITDTYNSTTRTATIVTKRDWLNAWGSGHDDHPWSIQESPRYFFDGMDDSEPPQQQWKRVPTPVLAVTGTILARPYFTLLTGTGDAQYTELPPHAVAAVREHIRVKWARFTKDWTSLQHSREAREEELAANAISDNPNEANTGPVTIDLPNVFKDEMNVRASNNR